MLHELCPAGLLRHRALGVPAIYVLMTQAMASLNHFENHLQQVISLAEDVDLDTPVTDALTYTLEGEVDLSPIITNPPSTVRFWIQSSTSHRSRDQLRLGLTTSSKHCPPYRPFVDYCILGSIKTRTNCFFYFPPLSLMS